MVQIIRRTPHKTTSDYMADALRAYGEGQGIESKKESLKYEKDTNNKKLKELGFDVEGLSPDMQKAYITQKLKEDGDEKKRTAKLDAWKQFYGEESPQKDIGSQLNEGEPEPLKEEPRQIQQEKPKPLEKGRKKWTDKQIALAQIDDPGQAKIMQSQNDITIREERAETTAQAKLDKEERDKLNEKNENLRKEVLPFRQELAQRAESAQRAKESYEEQKSLIDSGKLDDPSYAAFLENLPFKIGQRFLSPETSEYKGALVQNFNILKNLFSGATRIKELEIVEDKIAGIYLTDEQKKGIIKSLQRAADLDLIRAEAALEIDKENKPMGIIEYQNELNKRAKEKQSLLFDRILDEQNAIIKDAENARKMPLNWANPEDKQVMMQIYKEADENFEEAKKIAKKKGYSW